jgi:hypothetical protein
MALWPMYSSCSSCCSYCAPLLSVRHLTLPSTVTEPRVVPHGGGALPLMPDWMQV